MSTSTPSRRNNRPLPFDYAFARLFIHRPITILMLHAVDGTRRTSSCQPNDHACDLETRAMSSSAIQGYQIKDGHHSSSASYRASSSNDATGLMRFDSPYESQNSVVRRSWRTMRFSLAALRKHSGAVGPTRSRHRKLRPEDFIKRLQIEGIPSYSPSFVRKGEEILRSPHPPQTRLIQSGNRYEFHLAAPVRHLRDFGSMDCVGTSITRRWTEAFA